MGELRSWHYTYVYSIESRLIMRPRYGGEGIQVPVLEITDAFRAWYSPGKGGRGGWYGTRYLRLRTLFVLGTHPESKGWGEIPVPVLEIDAFRAREAHPLSLLRTCVRVYGLKPPTLLNTKHRVRHPQHH